MGAGLTAILWACRPRQMRPVWGLARLAIVECTELLPVARIYDGRNQVK